MPDRADCASQTYMAGRVQLLENVSDIFSSTHRMHVVVVTFPCASIHYAVGEQHNWWNPLPIPHKVLYS